MSHHADCHASRARILDEVLAQGAVSTPRLASHLAGCAECQRAVAQMGDGLHLLADAEGMPANPLVVDRQIARAVAAPAGARATRRPSIALWLFGAIAATATVVAGVSLVITQLGTPTELATGARVVAGALARTDDAARGARDSQVAAGALLPEDQLLAVIGSTPVHVRLQDGSTLEAPPATHFRARHQPDDGWVFALQAGALNCTVTPRPTHVRQVHVTTDEARITVVGTRFAVARSDDAVTRVQVTKGRVLVEARADSEQRTLQAGDVVWVDANGFVTATPVASDGPAPTVSPMSDAAQKRLRAQVRAIRSQIEARQIDRARAAIRAAQREAGTTRTTLAELAMLDAEALLALERYEQSIAAYLAVQRSFSRTEQAETALFAAAQIAFKHPGPRFDGKALLERYLRLYPRGVFRAEAQLLLKRGRETTHDPP